ncbi:peroxiredoxin family protein [Sediminitomix flava]|uniref:Peroxiredoxin n=1 Tax=Sediminitomix flava TaxID=379075 RepID=A0A315Z8Y8_SEDFL|nr:TlpA disulfide reductase family protein [Sediminitomix flava]PWJ42036.1 peroxiredoxin [Sediminitomix flava]
MKLHFYLPLITAILFFACTNSENGNNETALETNFSNGIWRGTIINDHNKEVPFLFEVTGEAEKSIFLINGEEKLLLNEVKSKEDSLVIPMLVYDAEIVAKLEDNTLNGYYNRLGAYKLAFKANLGNESTTRFEVKEQPTQKLSPKYATSFFYDNRDPKTAVGLFEQNGEKVTGTFMSETGDYRFLEGVLDGNALKLSAFDGSHIYRFEATVDGDSIKDGIFWSGKSWEQKWNAQKDDNAKLRDASTLTSLKEGYETIEFSFPNEEGKMISLSDDRYKGKVVILQILGTWCPNCMDETKFLAPYYDKNKDKGVEIIGLAFENADNLEAAAPKLKRMKNKLGVNYELLYAAKRESGATEKALPAISKVMSYPTTIFIDKKGKVRKIHTGFSGPGTGKYYEEFQEDFNLFMDKLIEEKM